ncbi:MAG: hypothetical protein JSW73_02825 [Candidatus Woesearchaeota archaeon]|nr:MAG: hypothetical protein JSW73_02825 [Candidatus Woesearchaeota archaeon]
MEYKMVDRYLIETEFYLPENQLPRFKKIGLIEDHWVCKNSKGDGISLDHWSKDNPIFAQIEEALSKQRTIEGEIKNKYGTVPVKMIVYPGAFILSQIKKEFLDECDFLIDDSVKKILPEVSDCKSIGDKVLVETPKGIKEGWFYHGCTYGCLGSNEEAIIYRGGSGFLGTDKNLIQIIDEE